MKCNLDYIPKHLHSNEKPIIDNFLVGEELYYRCRGGKCLKPYDNISLYDISHNRNFSNKNDYISDDVLYNISEENAFERYEDFNYIVLVLKELNDKITYNKKLISVESPEKFVEITLKHQPVPCMYPHSIFELIIDGVVVNRENYKKTLGKKGIVFKNLRHDVRQELTSIIQTRMIDASEEVEIIDEP